jgi:hypothetical protein
MDEKRYSLNDIFGLLREATLILSKPVAVVSDTTKEPTKMLLSEYIAMAVAHELTSDTSRMASEETTASKEDVVAALTANHYDEVVHPNYEHFGISWPGAGGRSSGSSQSKKRKTLRSNRRH